jgi:hypothetical protein
MLLLLTSGPLCSIGWCHAISVPETTPTVYTYLPSYEKLGNCLTVPLQVLSGRCRNPGPFDIMLGQVTVHSISECNFRYKPQLREFASK